MFCFFICSISRFSFSAYTMTCDLSLRATLQFSGVENDIRKYGKAYFVRQCFYKPFRLLGKYSINSTVKT